MKYLGFIWRVLRRLVWETATDNTTGLAAQMAYLLLFALAPGSLFLWHLLGLFGTDPSKLHRMFVLLKSFMPPDQKVQDILDSAMAKVVVTTSPGLEGIDAEPGRRLVVTCVTGALAFLGSVVFGAAIAGSTAVAKPDSCTTLDRPSFSASGAARFTPARATFR